MKLSSWTYIVIGLCLGLSVLGFVFIQIYMPYEQKAQFNNDYRAALEVEAAKQQKAEQRVKDAMDLVNSAATRWNAVVLTKTPPPSLSGGGVNLAVNGYQLVVDTHKFRNNIQRAFNAQVRRGGVKVVSGPTIPIPGDNPQEVLASFYNYPGFNFPVVLFDLGTVTVSGNYNQITANVRLWSSMPRYLAVVDGLRIDGTTPNLTATYNVTIVGFLRGNTIYPAPPDVSSGSGNTLTGGPGGR